MSHNFNQDQEEKIIWKGKPAYRPFLLTGIYDFIGSVKWLIFVCGFFVVISIVGKFALDRTVMTFIILLTIGGSLYKLLEKLFQYRKTIYWVTNKSVYIQKGASKESVKVIKRKAIVYLDMQANKMEKKYNAGTILIFCGEVKETDGKEEKVFYKLESLSEPNYILRLF